MIIWRGWGIVAAGLAVAAMVLGAAVKAVTHQIWTFPFSAGLGMFAAAVAAWFIGRRLNVTGAAVRADRIVEQERAKYHAAAQRGQFSLGEGYARPSSLQEAHEQADALADSHRAGAHQALRNVHTIFFIPVQYAGALLVPLGIVLVWVGLDMSRSR